MKLSKENFYNFLPSAYSAVETFHRAFELPIRRSWADSTKAGRELRANLIEEEFTELINSIDPVLRLDAYCDLLYVLLGTFLELGYGQHKLTDTDYHRLPPFTGQIPSIITQLRAKSPCFRRLGWGVPDATADVAKEGWKTFPHFPEAFMEVHRNNMTKLWVNRPADPDVIVKEVYQAKYLVKRKSDGKVLKPADFKPVDLTPFV
jgi:predicted HAD superfamily Cof-like phosphohydrolase